METPKVLKTEDDVKLAFRIAAILVEWLANERARHGLTLEQQIEKYGDRNAKNEAEMKVFLQRFS